MTRLRTAELIEAARSYTIFIPILLGVLCGLRRGEIAALRWRSIDLDAGQLAVVASIEQTKAGCREKETKSGRCRTIALPALLIDELRKHRTRSGEALLSIGVRVSADHSRRHAGRWHAAEAEQSDARLHDVRGGARIEAGAAA